MQNDTVHGGVRQEGSGEAVVMSDEVSREVEDGRPPLAGRVWRPLGERVLFRAVAGPSPVITEDGLKPLLDGLADVGRIVPLVCRRRKWVPVDEPVRFEVSRGVEELWRTGWFVVSADELIIESGQGRVAVCVLRDVTDTRPVVAEVGRSGED